MADRHKPIVVITGAAGGVGQALSDALRDDYTIIGLDRSSSPGVDASYTFDLTAKDSVESALTELSRQHGRAFAAVIHLAAYFDFSGDHSPLYDAVNVAGTRNLLESLRAFDVDRFIYSGTMLVHRPGSPGSRIDEESPLGPRWAYPESKAEAEAVIREHAGNMPYTILRMAGLYDEQTCVPTLSHQIARIYEKDLKSYLYSGDTSAGQAFLHRDDMIDAFQRCVARRHSLPRENFILVGEENTESYEALQDRLGALIHGESVWPTLSVPEPMAKVGAWVEEKAEPVVPDAFDHGEKPFIRPFMIELASDHYALDISRAREQLGWEPQHDIRDGLTALVENLKNNPLAWYEANGITPPDWIESAEQRGTHPDKLFEAHAETYLQQHRQNLWARFLLVALGAWLMSSPATLGYTSTAMTYSDIGAGLGLLVLSCLSLSVRFGWTRWICGAIGLWVLFAPLAFWTPHAAAYLNGMLAGMVIIGLAIVVPPVPGISPAARVGPTTPPGWDNNPSGWLQRAPIIVLAFVGLIISRYMAAYQMGHIDAVWDPFFSGATDLTKNGTEDIITSSVSEAWPVPDAGMGALVYALEVLVGLAGSTQRWRTMPWLVALFGLMIVPLGAVSITFIIIQPVILDTWCTLCLIAAAAMLMQIPYALNELVATGQFLQRRHAAGRPVLKIFFTGDTDEGKAETGSEFDRPAAESFRKAISTGVGLPYGLALCILVGVWLMLTRLTLGHGGGLANWEHLVGALVITIAACATAEVARPVRFLVMPLAVVMFVVPFVYAGGTLAVIASCLAGMALIALCMPRGPIKGRYGAWNQRLV